MDVHEPDPIDERTQAVFVTLLYGSYQQQLAAARVVTAAQDYVAVGVDGVNDTLSLQTARLGALRLALHEYDQLENPEPRIQEVD